MYLEIKIDDVYLFILSGVCACDGLVLGGLWQRRDVLLRLGVSLIGLEADLKEGKDSML